MNFKFYDVISHLIPGFLVYSSLLISQNISADFFPVIPAIAIAYILGYIINTISSWIENILFWTWGGEPLTKLVEGKSIWKVRFKESEKLQEMLKKESGEKDLSYEDMGQLAMRKVSSSENPRLSDFNASYAFSRAIFTGLMISTILLAIILYSNPIFWIIAIGSLIICWLRAKQRAYYWAREVFFTYLNNNDNNSNS